jgi:hypothetical protein
MAERLNRARGAVAVVLPEKGWSIYGSAGGPLHNPRADAALVRSLTQGLRPDIAVHHLPLNINDPAFAAYCCQLLDEFLRDPQRTHLGPAGVGTAPSRLANATAPSAEGSEAPQQASFAGTDALPAPDAEPTNRTEAAAAGKAL